MPDHSPELDDQIQGLRVENLSVEIDGASLLAPTSVTARPGEFWALTGANGAGKTTLLRTMLGLQPRAGGTSTWDGEPVDLERPEHRRAVASLVDPIPVARDMTVHEQVTLVATSWLAGLDEAVAVVDATISDLGLGFLAERYPHQLSAGQLQLFLLALTLVRPADLLVLDEPERHLDTGRVRRLAELLRARADRGVVVVAATHDPAMSAQIDGTIHPGPQAES